MIRILFAATFSLLLAGCGAARHHVGVADSFVNKWCDREKDLTADEAMTIGALVTAAGTSDCYSAAKALADKTTLELGDSSLVVQLKDLRPIASFTQVKVLRLSYLGLDSVQPLYVLQSLPNLVELELNNNALTNVRGLSRYTKKLIRLNLSGNPLVETTPIFSALETVSGWQNLRTLEMVEAKLARIPEGIPLSVSTLDMRKNVFTKDAFVAALKPSVEHPRKLPELKLVFLQEAFAVPEPERAPLVQEAQKWLPETHFKTF